MLYASTVQAQKSYKSLEGRQLRLGSKVSKAPNSVLKEKRPGAKKIVKHRNGALENTLGIWYIQSPADFIRTG